MRATVCEFNKVLAPALAGLVLLVSSALSAAEPGRISVAVTVDDVEAIARVVGGDQVDTFTLFKGCILRKDLNVEKVVQGRLLKADAVVWTGFFNESAAIHDSVKLLDQRVESPPLWIDVSRGVKRINVPTSSCFGYVEVSFMHGDPFFWLNPQNGVVIARDLAEGFAELRPEKKSYFLANAEAFGKALEKDIVRWQAELVPLKGLRIFSAQCGWQNFAQIGGPSFASCKNTPGQLPSPEKLVDHVKRMKVQLIIVDPNTPPEYGRAFREETGAKVIEVPSSVENLAGSDRSYSALFDHLIGALQAVAKEQAAMEK